MTEWKSYLYAEYMKGRVKQVKKPKQVKRKRVFKAEKGKISGVAIIVIAVVVLAVGGGIFFLSKNGSGSGSPLTALQGATLNPNCELKDPELCKFINNWKVMKNYSMSSVTTDSSGAKSESLYEIAGDDSLRMLAKEKGKDIMEMITIGKTTYTKDYTDNKWWKHTYEETNEETNNELTKEITETTSFDDTKAVEDKTEYKAMGKEACGNLNCFKYQIVTPGDNSTQLIWFDDREYLLRKQSSIDEEGNVFEGTFTYNNVSISAPSPVKEGTPEQMYMQQMSADDKAQYEQMQKDAEVQMKQMQEEYNVEMPVEDSAPEEY